MTYNATIHQTLRSGRTSKTMVRTDSLSELLSHVQSIANKATREVVNAWLDGKTFKGLPSSIRVDLAR